MNKESIIAMALEAKLIFDETVTSPWIEDTDLTPYLERFATLVATAERNHCSARADIALLGADRALRDRVLKAINIRKAT